MRLFKVYIHILIDVAAFSEFSYSGVCMVIGCCSDEEDHEELEIDVEDDVEEDLGAAAGGQEEGESSFSTSSPSFSSWRVETSG